MIIPSEKMMGSLDENIEDTYRSDARIGSITWTLRSIADVFLGNEDGKVGFFITLGALLVLVGFFGMSAFTSVDLSPMIPVGALGAAFVGHFLLGGGQFRAKILEKQKIRK